MKWVLLGSMCLLPLSCAASQPVLPLSSEPPAPAEVTLVWVGEAKAERLEAAGWQRIPEFDYDFSVVQRRFEDHWESVKSMHRRHPAYDGSAGPRDQTLFFRIDYAPVRPDGGVTSRVAGSLGEGSGRTDPEFRRAVLELNADVSSLAPFNLYRITQDYRYGEGALEETVDLLKRSDGTDTPWVRNHERAQLFGPQRFAQAPSRR